MFNFFFYGYGDHRDLHVLTHSFPTRRASDLPVSVSRRRQPGADGDQQRVHQLPIPLPPWRPAEVGRRCAQSPSLRRRSEEHTSELQSLMRTSYAVSCLKKKITLT